MNFDASLWAAADRHMAARYGGPSGTHTCYVERDVDGADETAEYTLEVEVEDGALAAEGRIVEVDGPAGSLAVGAMLALTPAERERFAEDFAMAADESRGER